MVKSNKCKCMLGDLELVGRAADWRTTRCNSCGITETTIETKSMGKITESQLNAILADLDNLESFREIAQSTLESVMLHLDKIAEDTGDDVKRGIKSANGKLIDLYMGEFGDGAE